CRQGEDQHKEAKTEDAHGRIFKLRASFVIPHPAFVIPPYSGTMIWSSGWSLMSREGLAEMSLRFTSLVTPLRRSLVLLGLAKGLKPPATPTALRMVMPGL